MLDPSSLSVGQYMQRWIDDRDAAGSLRPTTSGSYRRVLRPAIERFSTLRLEALTPSHLDSLYRDLSTIAGRGGTGLSARTVRFTHSVIRKALADAQRKGLLSRNVADAADPPGTAAARPPEPVLWSASETLQFLEAPWLPDNRRIAWEMAFGTGLRRGELTALRWDDIEGPLIRVRRNRTVVGHEVFEGPPKSHKSVRDLHVGARLGGLLRRWRSRQAAVALRTGIRHEFVLTDALRQPWHPNAMTHAWSKDVRRAIREGLVPVRTRLHDCRHWHATQLVAAGVDLNTVADRIGHASAAFTLSVYGHSDATRDEAAAAAVDAALEAWGDR